MKAKLMLCFIGVGAVAIAIVCFRYRDELDIAWHTPWKLHCSWVEEVPAYCLEAECNTKIFKAFQVFRSGKGKYGLKRWLYETDGAPSIQWILIEDGKASSGTYSFHIEPHEEKRTLRVLQATDLTIGYFRSDPNDRRMQFGDEWVDDERGLAISNEHYLIQFTKPERLGGF